MVCCCRRAEEFEIERESLWLNLNSNQVLQRAILLLEANAVNCSSRLAE
jgi:hypothetical protein